ncbi:MAG TPA: hypothetical protein PLN65_06925, partial [Enterococcus sp.]|nr:hypothetical protein [Enterococcus sp.]
TEDGYIQNDFSSGLTLYFTRKFFLSGVYNNTIVKNSFRKHERILKALKYEIEIRTLEGSLKYMKRLPKWLNSEEQLAPEYMGTTGNIGELSQNLYDLATFLKSQGSISEVPEISVFEEAINPTYIEKMK